MSSHRCAACNQEPHGTVRIAVLEQMNADLLQMVKTLIEKRVQLNIAVHPMTNELARIDIEQRMAKKLAMQTMALLEENLQRRSELVRELYDMQTQFHMVLGPPRYKA